jgi:hypothetical protein
MPRQEWGKHNKLRTASPKVNKIGKVYSCILWNTQTFHRWSSWCITLTAVTLMLPEVPVKQHRASTMALGHCCTVIPGHYATMCPNNDHGLIYVQQWVPTMGAQLPLLWNNEPIRCSSLVREECLIIKPGSSGLWSRKLHNLLWHSVCSP